MGILYNIGIGCYTAAISVASVANTKARLWLKGRKALIERVESDMAQDRRPKIWIHSASLGEFEQARPIIERIRTEHPEYSIVVTFFSPSGYEIRKNYSEADHIYYLPSDTQRNAKRFVEAVAPRAAIFIKYEFWLNYLSELRRRSTPTYLVSAIFRRNSIFFQPWGWAWRRALATFDTLFVQNDISKQLLSSIGYDNVVVAGDTRFDRVAAIAKHRHPIPIIERFRGDSRLFIAGSTWGPDEQILIELINQNRDIRFVIAPHEMDEARIGHIIASVKGGAVRYTESTDQSDFGSAQVLILDTIGVLSSAYSYATWAYIGGGFGVGIHNTLEAATFGLPIAFGPKYSKFQEACDMIELRAAQSVRSAEELKSWFKPLRDDENHLERASLAAKGYAEKNCGATSLITEAIFASIK